MNIAELLAQVRSELGIQTDFTLLMLTMALMVSRILPTILLTPMMGGDSTPTEVKLGLGLLLGVVMFPQVADRMQYVPVHAVPFALVLLKEIFVGFCISFVVGMVFHAAEVAGQLMDHLSGSNHAQITVPALGHQVSLFSALKSQLVVVLFFSLHGHHLVISGIADSLTAIPLDSFPAFSHGMWGFFELIIRVAADLLRVSIAMAAPVLMATFLSDMALGLVNRVAPQIQVFFMAGQLKPAVTVLVVFVTIHLILDRVTQEYGVMFLWLKRTIYLFS